ncbi:MAG: SDR family NAD(P)-dependent oxidoreductase [Ruminococcus sp.]|jgi:NAD(P)-dependent dehydrogenase (short-subunit alcohol dehydrogenase family)|uniref:SDR family NAD(P)-dependent oxidoreductase n=1 Tax=Ruminococcus sp. TaxID=41978 RepID=UPI0025E72706|nr:SDR family NAD(P)-dependent oxidoreductase [Ruminococcus sp.]MBE6870251.1 SDR family NAD(P)-dependent oxidoreductase [Ruminococcus albus]MBO4867974.1 SDR family NAD(P)-dependent oxidoreductase [Ruminococcus sp.]
MSQNVMITGAGKAVGLGYNLVLRYLEAGDTVVATIRKPCAELDELKKQYGSKLFILTMDIGSTESVQAAADELSKKIDKLDLLINNAVSVSPDCDKGFFDADLDYIARTVDITAVGAMRVIKAFYPMLKKSDMTALIMNISSEAGSISKCYRTNMIDYGMAKAALNMATMNLVNTFKDDRGINIFCVHPGWIRTDGRADNPAPLSSYEAAEILRELFEKKRNDFEGHRFITNLDEDYPF